MASLIKGPLRIIGAAGAFAGICASSSAFAQGAPAAAPQDETAPADRTGGIADIIVTATRNEQRLQRVPLAVSAYDAKTLTQSNVTDLLSVSRLSPGIQIQPQFTPANATFQIRGQFQNTVGPTVDPSVSFYFDDVYVSDSAGSLINLVDVSRVEVLKGPQGTLFGKNTTGGAVQVISNRPVHSFEGYVDATYESYDRYKLLGVVNLPMSETLAVRLVGQHVRKTGGYATNIVNGTPIDTENQYFARASALWEPTDRLHVLLEGDYSHYDNGGLAGILRAYIPANDQGSALDVGIETGNGLAALFAGNPVPAITAGQQILAGLATGHGSRTVGTDLRALTSSSYTFTPGVGYSIVGGTTNPFYKGEIYGFLANISYDFDFGTLKSITAYRHVDSRAAYDIDGTRYTVGDGMLVNKSEQFSQELILSGKALSDRLDWTVGGLYFNAKPRQDTTAFVLGGLSALFTNSGANTTVGISKNVSYGVFGQATYKLTDQFSVTGGIRYSVDTRDFVAQSFTRTPAGTSSCDFNAASGLPALPNFRAPCDILQHYHKGQVSYTTSANYQIEPSKLIYVRTSHSYRSGGFNPSINVPASVQSFNPESVTDYELGIKADWLDRKLRTNIAVFHSRGKDIQFTLGSVVNGVAVNQTVNLGTRTVNGFELELIAKPAPLLTFDASVSYLDASVKNPTQPDVTYAPVTPPWAVNVGTTVDMPFSQDVSGSLRVDLSYRDKMHDGTPFRDGTGAIIYQGFYCDVTLLGARFTLHHEPTGIDVSVFGRNLTDQIYEAISTPIAGLGLDVGSLAEPRVIGIELKVPFGKH